MMRTIAVAVLAMVALAIPAEAGPSATSKVGCVQVDVKLNRAVYNIGESVDIALTVANRGSEDASFQFNTGQMYDFIVMRERRHIWQWSYERAFTQAFTTLKLRPAESKIFRERWSQQDTQGRQVLPGTYELLVVFPAGGSRLGIPGKVDGPRVPFTIAAGSVSRNQSPSVASRSATIAGNTVGEVLINDRPVLRIRAAAGGFSALRRAEIVATRLQHLLSQGLKPEELLVVSVGAEAAIMWRGQLVVTIDANNAHLHNMAPFALATDWLKALTRALSSAQ